MRRFRGYLPLDVPGFGGSRSLTSLQIFQKRNREKSPIHPTTMTMMVWSHAAPGEECDDVDARVPVENNGYMYCLFGLPELHLGFTRATPPPPPTSPPPPPPTSPQSAASSSSSGVKTEEEVDEETRSEAHESEEPVPTPQHAPLLQLDELEAGDRLSLKGFPLARRAMTSKTKLTYTCQCTEKHYGKTLGEVSVSRGGVVIGRISVHFAAVAEHCEESCNPAARIQISDEEDEGIVQKVGDLRDVRIRAKRTARRLNKKKVSGGTTNRKRRLTSQGPSSPKRARVSVKFVDSSD